MSDLFRSLLQQATAQGSRSTALNPLAWAFGIVLFALLAAARVPNLPFWVLPLLGGTSALFGLSFMVAYFILLFKDRDALRSEKFTLSKMALEKNITGDSLKGFIAEELSDRPVPSIPSETIEQPERPR
jgi:hypothetical protein